MLKGKTFHHPRSHRQVTVIAEAGDQLRVHLDDNEGRYEVWWRAELDGFVAGRAPRSRWWQLVPMSGTLV